ncbi:MAG: SMI1/KNR4 family protein [Acidobacteria bacterium]|nr:SMI1/KNR4 family protein [Acidobacteriota bacterium]
MIESLLLPEDLKSFSLGYSGLRFFNESELSDGQLGYSVDPDGRSLAGSNPGDWKDGWTVIGYDERCGDPIFVDLNSEGFPVFTAVHGLGEWTPKQIGDTLESFRKCVDEISAISIGRENPVKLEANPISNLMRQEVLKKIKSFSLDSDLEFWELTMGFY